MRSDLGLMGCRLCGTLVPPRTEVVDAAEFYAELCGNLQPFLECAARCGMPRALYVALKVARAATEWPFVKAGLADAACGSGGDADPDGNEHCSDKHIQVEYL